jgi:hypothetical protein
MRLNIPPPRPSLISGRILSAAGSRALDHPPQESFTIAITIDASRQATRITIAPIQIRGMPRS